MHTREAKFRKAHLKHDHRVDRLCHLSIKNIHVIKNSEFYEDTKSNVLGMVGGANRTSLMVKRRRRRVSHVSWSIIVD